MSLVPNIWAGVIIPMPFAFVALVLRLKARRMTRMGTGFDDVLCILAWVSPVLIAILREYQTDRCLAQILAVGYSAIVLICASTWETLRRVASWKQPLLMICSYRDDALQAGSADRLLSPGPD